MTSGYLCLKVKVCLFVTSLQFTLLCFGWYNLATKSNIVKEITNKIFKTGDRDNYKMEMLEEHKSSELQERFLQVKISQMFRKRKIANPFDI